MNGTAIGHRRDRWTRHRGGGGAGWAPAGMWWSPWVRGEGALAAPRARRADARSGRPVRPRRGWPVWSPRGDGRGGRAAARRRQPRRRLRVRRAGGTRTPIEEFEAPVRPQPPPGLPGHRRRAAPPARGGRRRRSCAWSTRAALRPFSGAAGYISSKAAVLGFVRALDAGEYRQDRIRNNAILPTRDEHPGQPGVPAGRRPLQVGRRPPRSPPWIRFLCSDESAPIGGAEIPVYGGP